MKIFFLSITILFLLSCSKEKFNTFKESMLNKSIKGREMLIDTYFSIDKQYTLPYATVVLSIPASVTEGFTQTASPMKISVINTSSDPIKLYSTRTRLQVAGREFKAIDKNTMITDARNEDMKYLSNKQVEQWKETDHGIREQAVKTVYMETISIQPGMTGEGIVYFDRLAQNYFDTAPQCFILLFFDGKDTVTVTLKNFKFMND